VKESYEVINIVFLHEEGVYGTVEQMGAFLSMVKYTKDEIEYNEFIENDEFAIVDEIVFHHIEEDK
jgi:hypothetical protein